MVWFTFTFLLGVPQTSNNQYENEPKLNNEDIQNNYVEIDVSKPNFMCHIEFVLIPGQIPKFVDVVCWDNAVKIYYENSTSAIKPLVVGNIRWIYFRINHYINLLNEEIPVMNSHNIIFTITIGNKNLGDSAKFENVKKFYKLKTTDGNCQTQLFEPLSQSLNDLERVSFFKGHLTAQQQLYISLDTTIETSSNNKSFYRSIKDLSNEYQDKNFKRMPTPKYQQLPPLKKISELYKIEISTDKKDKEVDKKKEEPRGLIEFSLPGEHVFSGKKRFEYCIKYNSEELPYILCVAEVKDPLNRLQSQYFNPLSICINSCKFLPLSSLQEYSVKLIKFQYTVCNEFLVETNLIPVDYSLKLNYIRTIFTNTIDKTQLIYFIKTNGIKIKMLGKVEEEKPKVKRILFNNQNVNKNVYHKSNEILQIKNPENLVLLGTASADISSILLQPHSLLLKCDLKIPPDTSVLLNQNNKNFITLNEFNSKCKMKNNIALSKSHSTILTLFVRIHYPLTKHHQKVMMNPLMFNRLFAVLYDTNLAISVIKSIQTGARGFLEPINHCDTGINIKRPLTKKHTGTISVNKIKNYQLTGFLIDCVDQILLYVEGSLSGNIQHIWALVSTMKPCQGHVLYDNTLIFTDRLYKSFYMYGGIVKVILKEDLKVTISQMKCKKGNDASRSARKAIDSLKFLVNCRSIKIACENNLFPDPDSLNSMGLEFGVPIQN